MKKKSLFLLISLLLFVLLFKSYYFNPNTKYEICMDNNFVITSVQNNLHTISYFSEQYDGKMRLIRGKIEGYAVINNSIIGYLSDRYFVEQDIEKYKGEHDKEGFFIIDMKKKEVISGLSNGELKRKLQELNIDKLPHLKKITPYARISCWARSLVAH